MTVRALIATALAALVFPAAASAAPQVVLKAGPNPAHRGDRIAAEVAIRGATGTVNVGWLVDGKAATKFDDKTELATSFSTLGSHEITVGVTDSLTGKVPVTDTVTIVVVNAPPNAAIAATPDAPLTGTPVALSSASTDPDGEALTCSWDLDGDGAFETPGCSTAQTFAKAGAYIVGLRVSDGHETSTALRGITVTDPPAEPVLIAPLEQPVAAPAAPAAPVVAASKPAAKIAATLRYAFTRTASTATFTSLVLRNVPVGASVKAKVTGGKPFATTAKSATVSLKPLTRRRLKAGATITVEVTKPGMAGRSVTLTVRKGKDPKIAAK